MKEGRVKVEDFSAKAGARSLRVPQVPLEWYGNNCWRLPSGQALAEFALQAGFLAPLLFKPEVFSRNDRSSPQSTDPIGHSKQLKKVKPS
jgi:hypothetical protein